MGSVQLVLFGVCCLDILRFDDLVNHATLAELKRQNRIWSKWGPAEELLGNQVQVQIQRIMLRTPGE